MSSEAAPSRVLTRSGPPPVTGPTRPDWCQCGHHCPLLVAAMKIAALSDIHGNLAALDAVLTDIRSAGADLIVYFGFLSE